jgi:hypothetical protein
MYLRSPNNNTVQLNMIKYTGTTTRLCTMFNVPNVQIVINFTVKKNLIMQYVINNNNIHTSLIEFKIVRT